MKCPNCGHEMPSKPVYQYRGNLAPYLPTILKLLRTGKGPRAVYDDLVVLYGEDFDAEFSCPTTTIVTIGNISRRYGITPQPPHSKRQRNLAMAERYAQGETYQAIADDFGISKGRVRQLVMRAKRDEMRKTALERGYGYGDCTIHAASRALRRYRSDVE